MNIHGKFQVTGIAVLPVETRDAISKNGRTELDGACEVRRTAIDMEVCFPEAIGVSGIYDKAEDFVLAMPQHTKLQKQGMAVSIAHV